MTSSLDMREELNQFKFLRANNLLEIFFPLEMFSEVKKKDFKKTLQSILLQLNSFIHGIMFSFLN